MKSGQAIVEVLLAFAAAVIAIVALVQVATRSVSNSGVSSRQAVASAYAGQGMEWVRGQRDSLGWGVFSATPYSSAAGINHNLGTLSWSAAGVQIGTSEFSRVVRLQTLAGPPSQVLATVTVSWSEGKITGGLKSTQTTIFSNY